MTKRVARTMLLAFTTLVIVGGISRAYADCVAPGFDSTTQATFSPGDLLSIRGSLEGCERSCETGCMGCAGPGGEEYAPRTARRAEIRLVDGAGHDTILAVLDSSDAEETGHFDLRIRVPGDAAVGAAELQLILWMRDSRGERTGPDEMSVPVVIRR